jgi:hypothetical protein
VPEARLRPLTPQERTAESVPGEVTAADGWVARACRNARRAPRSGGAGGRGDAGERDRVREPERAEGPRALCERLPRSPARERRQGDDRQRPSSAERETGDEAETRVAEREADARDCPHAERQHEGREAEPEENAVRRRRERQRQHAPPRLRHLAANLRDDTDAAELSRRRSDRDCHGRTCGDGAAGPVHDPPEHGEGGKRRHAACERPQEECGARRRGRAGSSLGTPDRVHHREAAGRPRAGHAGHDCSKGNGDG